MKQICILIMSMALVFSFFGCGSEKEKSNYDVFDSAYIQMSSSDGSYAEMKKIAEENGLIFDEEYYTGDDMVLIRETPITDEISLENINHITIFFSEDFHVQSLTLTKENSHYALNSSPVDVFYVHDMEKGVSYSQKSPEDCVEFMYEN